MPKKLTEALLDQYRKRFEDGDAFALIDAIDACARSGVAAPVWLANEWCRCIDDYRFFRAPTLDAAFNIKRPKRMKPAKQIDRERLKPLVVIEVERLRPMPLDEAMWEAVGKRLRITPSRAKNIYYAADNPWRESPWRKYYL